MENALDRFMMELSRGLYTDIPQGTYTPTLVVGLGGTGIKVLRHLKKSLLKNRVQQIRLLGIDTDNSENGKFPELPGLSEPRELVCLDAAAAVRALARAERSPEAEKHTLAYLPFEHETMGPVHSVIRGKINLNKGAGQVRRAGKLMFNANVSNGKNLVEIINGLQLDLRGLNQRMELEVYGHRGGAAPAGQGAQVQTDVVPVGVTIDTGCQIYVVSSLAGGTGAGCLIDMLALLRSRFNGGTDRITAIGVLPGKSLDKLLTDPRKEKANTRGNALAILTELQGFMLGKFRDHTFVFDEAVHYKPGNQNLVNNVYVVSDTMFNGTRVGEWMDLCQATSLMLFGVLGSGVGAAQTAGAVNHDVSVDAITKANPELFNTFGVALLEYPVDEIMGYAFRYTTEKLLAGWLDERIDPAEAKTALASLKSTLGIASLQDVMAEYNFNAGTVAEARYLKAGSQDRKDAMGKGDDEFVGHAEAVVAGIDGELATYDGRLSRSTEEILKRFEAKYGAWLRRKMTSHQGTALFVCEKFSLYLEALRKEFDQGVEVRAKEAKKILSDIDRMKRKVHRYDMKMDILFGMRQDLIKLVNAYLDNRLAAHLEDHIASLLTRMENMARNLWNEAKTVNATLGNLQRENTKQMAMLLTAKSRPGFVQFAMDLEGIPAWVEQLKIPVHTQFDAAELRSETMLRQALQGVDTAIRGAVSSYSLHHEASARGKAGELLRSKIKALGTASEPLIRLVESAPSPEDLTPQEFAVGLEPSALAKHVGGTRKEEIIPVDSQNHHTALYLRTLHEFAIQDWVEYAEAVDAWKKKPWYYHALPDAVKIPGIG